MPIEVAIAAINAAAATWVAGYIVYAVWIGWRTRQRWRVQMIVAAGSLWALSFMLAGTLLKTIHLPTWSSIGSFAVVLGMRTLAKRVFRWEYEHWNAKLAHKQHAQRPRS
jgi:uncharacterized membrane protein